MIPARYRRLCHKNAAVAKSEIFWDLIHDCRYLLEHLSLPFRLALITLETFLNAWTENCIINSLCLNYLNPLACQVDISG